MQLKCRDVRMVGAIIKYLVLSAVLLSIGCVGTVTSVTEQQIKDFISSSPHAQALLNDPETVFQATNVAASNISDLILDVRTACGDSISIKNYIKVELFSRNLTLTAWFDSARKRADCIIVKERNQTVGIENTQDCRSTILTGYGRDLCYIKSAIDGKDKALCGKLIGGSFGSKQYCADWVDKYTSYDDWYREVVSGSGGSRPTRIQLAQVFSENEIQQFESLYTDVRYGPGVERCQNVAQYWLDTINQSQLQIHLLNLSESHCRLHNYGFTLSEMCWHYGHENLSYSVFSTNYICPASGGESVVRYREGTSSMVFTNTLPPYNFDRFERVQIGNFTGFYGERNRTESGYTFFSADLLVRSGGHFVELSIGPQEPHPLNKQELLSLATFFYS